MITSFLKRIFGSRNQRTLRSMWKVVANINELEENISKLTDIELRDKTSEFRERYKQGASLDDLLPEAFAVVREASKRTLGMRHFDVQLLGGMVLHRGSIAEMRTGEGKTLMSTLAIYLNALPAKGVHLVTVNDYLASRDADWMGVIYKFLGMSVGVVLPNITPDARREAYAADITYATNNELGFDYLRDNMVYSLDDRVQRAPSYAIVDEVDSILIDEARTPLIISGSSEDSTELYNKVNEVAPLLTKQADKDSAGDYLVDEKAKQVTLSEDGHQHIEEIFTKAGLLEQGQSLYDSSNIMLMHHLNAALRAYAIYQRDVDYIVHQGEVVIVDEHTGRTMPGRRWSDGLHQAIEAKEGVKVNQENQTLASITFQNFFRLYEKLAGMTGTADTEAYEFHQIYGLEVVVLPTNKPMIRNDLHDFVYMTATEKFSAIIEDVQKCREAGQPVLVGTTSIETSEYLSDLLKKSNISHQVLNAKFHEKEASIIAQAGRPSAVTIATNMAGRGTDIVLGGNLEAELKDAGDITPEETAKRRADWQARHEAVLAAGGLYVLGTERHESRRIDNQLRGRSGRQGDPGKSRFYLSLQDNLLRIFGGERLIAIMRRLRMEEGTALESGLLTRNIESAQRKVEAHNFDIRKQLLEYDDVANEQRKVIYGQRDMLLSSDNLTAIIDTLRADVIDIVITQYIPAQSLEEQWEIAELEKTLQAKFSVNLPISQWLEHEDDLHEETLRDRLQKEIAESYKKKINDLDSSGVHQFEQTVMLQTLDSFWREHLSAMDYLRQGIHLRGYAQKNPKQEYKRESYDMFVAFLDRVNIEVISTLMRFEVQKPESQEVITPLTPNTPQFAMNYDHEEIDLLNKSSTNSEIADKNLSKTVLGKTKKVGRNEVCPCGSLKKYKHCHGVLG